MTDIQIESLMTGYHPDMKKLVPPFDPKWNNLSSSLFAILQPRRFLQQVEKEMSRLQGQTNAVRTQTL